jgi:Zn-dependent peptidase ImmA (M78 family)
MSMAALLYRAKDVGVMTPEAYLTAMKYMSARGWRKIEPGDREMGKPEAPTLLERALSITESELGLDQRKFVRSIGLPEDLALSPIRTAIDPRPRIRL